MESSLVGPRLFACIAFFISFASFEFRIEQNQRREEEIEEQMRLGVKFELVCRSRSAISIDSNPPAAALVWVQLQTLQKSNNWIAKIKIQVVDNNSEKQENIFVKLNYRIQIELDGKTHLIFIQLGFQVKLIKGRCCTIRWTRLSLGI